MLEADLGHATKSFQFARACPERYLNMGIAEQDMISTAAGLAACGMIPFATSFSIFSAGRAFEQVRNSVAYPNLNVKVVGTHAGVTVGPDGGSHQAVEDIALMQSVPNMTVLCPADDVETRAAVRRRRSMWALFTCGFPASAAKTFHADDYTMRIGKGELVRDSADVSIIATGLMTGYALEAANALSAMGIEAQVVNMCSIKAIDNELILRCAAKTGRVVNGGAQPAGGPRQHGVFGAGRKPADARAYGRHPGPFRPVGHARRIARGIPASRPLIS